MGSKHTDACRTKVADDVPIFVLHPQDRFAPLLVAIWCEMAEFYSYPDEKIDAAYVLRNRMLGWQADHGAQWPY